MFTAYDLSIIILYVFVLFFLGYLASKREKNSSDYFLGGRRMPWIAVMLSICATSLSALTFIGVPAVAFNGDFHYLQLAFGDLLGRFLIAGLLIGAFYRFKVNTVYEFLEHRLGSRTRDAGAGFFIVTRVLASSVRLAGCALALSVIFDLGFTVTILLIVIVSLMYTMLGGIKAVIWTDTIQFFLFVGAALGAIYLCTSALPDGFSQFLSVAGEQGKFQIFHLSTDPNSQDYWLSFSNPKSLIAGMILGCLTTFAALGTDQDLAQRMLTCKTAKESKKALILTAFLNFPITLLFLTVGAALAVFYQTFPDPTVAGYVTAGSNDKVFPYFIKTIAIPGVKGLLTIGILAAAMSSLDSALNALASSAYWDFFDRYKKKLSVKLSYVQTSRILVLFFAGVLALTALQFANTDSILWLGFRIFGYMYGAIVGAFILALIVRRKPLVDGTVVFAMLTSVVAVIFLTASPTNLGWVGTYQSQLFSFLKIEPIAWPWAIAIGCLWTITTSQIASSFWSSKLMNKFMGQFKKKPLGKKKHA